MPTWTSPHTFVDGELIGATLLNPQIRDNMLALMNPNNFILQNNSSTYTTTATTLATLTSTALVVQGGGPVQVGGQMYLQFPGGSGYVVLDVDGVQTTIFSGQANGNGQDVANISMLVTGLTVASHTFALKWRTSIGTVTGFISGAAIPLTFWAIEL